MSCSSNSPEIALLANSFDTYPKYPLMTSGVAHIYLLMQGWFFLFKKVRAHGERIRSSVSHAVDFPENRSAPILIEVTRGGMVESIHRGICVISDSTGSIYKSWGDHERPIYPRSAIKPLQAIPVVASGAAAALKMSSAELALCCASHSGERVHTEKVASWLKRLGLDATNLECGPQMPSDQETAEKLIQSGKNPLSLHNNCSGKHAGMLSTAIHNKQPTLGYTKADHPVQSDLIRLMSSLGNLDLSKTARGLDGCGIPVLEFSKVCGSCNGEIC